jgi:hypothetical protein
MIVIFIIISIILSFSTSWFIYLFYRVKRLVKTFEEVDEYIALSEDEKENLVNDMFWHGYTFGWEDAPYWINHVYENYPEK